VPEEFWLLMHSPHTLRHKGRFKLTLFLYANRMHPDAICHVLRAVIKPGRLHFIEQQLAEHRSGVTGTTTKRYYYFSVEDQINRCRCSWQMHSLPVLRGCETQ
jgi:hypothetical protein